MASVVVSIDDTISINTEPMVDVSSGAYSELTFPDELSSTETGKNGNAIITRKTAGLKGDLVLRVITGSENDKFLNNLLILQTTASSAASAPNALAAGGGPAPGFTLLTGYIAKNLVVNDKPVVNVYTMTGGSFTKQVETTSTTEGNAEQLIAVYRMRFAKITRGFE